MVLIQLIVLPILGGPWPRALLHSVQVCDFKRSEVMKNSLEAMEHYGFVVAMLAFAFMAYSGYSRDGDLINLAFAVVLTVLAILATYFRSFYRWKKDEDKS